MDVQDVPGAGFLPRHQFRHHFVDAPRPQAAAEAENDGALAGVQFAAGQVPVLHEDLRPHRVAHNAGLFRRAQLLHGGGHRGKNDVHVLGQQLVGHAGEGVLLVDGGADAHFRGTAHHRPADIAAAADDQVGLELPQHLFRPGPRQRQMIHRLHVAGDVLGGELSLDAVDLDMVEGIARLGDQAVFHAFPAAGKVDLGVRPVGLDGSRDGKRRVDVAGGAAGGNEHAHDFLSFGVRFCPPGTHEPPGGPSLRLRAPCARPWPGLPPGSH